MTLIRQLEAALETAALLVEIYPNAMPLFDRLEAELEAAMAADSVNPIERVRALRKLREQWPLAAE